jgi:hypothetical protein
MWHAWERKENCTGFWWDSPKEINRSEDRGINGRMGLEWVLERLAGERGGGCCGFSRPGIGYSGGLL